MEPKDLDLFETAIINSSFFKEKMRKAFSAGRVFKVEEFRRREENADLNSLPLSYFKFEEWFTKVVLEKEINIPVPKIA